jgi:hypothetical protein
MCFIYEENHLKRLNAVLYWQDVIELTHDSVQICCQEAPNKKSLPLAGKGLIATVRPFPPARRRETASG